MNMENKKQSSVDYYDEQFRKLISSLYKAEISLSNFNIYLDKVVNKAKQIHKKEIKESYNQGYRECEQDACLTFKDDKDISEYENAEQYYNETFIQ